LGERRLDSLVIEESAFAVLIRSQGIESCREGRKQADGGV